LFFYVFVVSLRHHYCTVNKIFFSIVNCAVDINASYITNDTVNIALWCCSWWCQTCLSWWRLDMRTAAWERSVLPIGV